MGAGKYNKRITIQSKTTTYNSYNEPIETWADKTTIWSAITTTGGSEFYAAQKLNVETSAVFTIRFINGITALDRIKYGSKIYEILGSPNNLNGKNKELQISAKEVV